MKFEPEFIDKVRDASNLVEYVAQYTELKPSSSGQYMGLCPYPDHNEKTPSFSVSETKQVYFCFGCKKSGNIFTFLQDIKGMGFPEAVKYLAEKAGIPLPKTNLSRAESDSLNRSRDEKGQLKKINRFAAKYFYENLKVSLESSTAKKYVEARGFSEEIIKGFGIGLSDDNWEGLAETLKSKGASLEMASKLGLVKKAKSGSRNKTGYFDMFRGRLMFPILSLSGDVVGFGGRVLSPEDKPKYLNSPETPLFHKGKTLYGLYETAKYIRTADQVLVVEGYTDLLGLYAVGIKNVVATLGTALTTDHAKLLKRLTKNVIVLFDGDRAGQAAAEKSLPILLSEGLHPRGLVLPEGMDPDEFVRKQGKEDLLGRLREASELFYQVMELSFRGFRGGAAEK